jgi:hypothetical protein
MADIRTLKISGSEWIARVRPVILLVLHRQAQGAAEGPPRVCRIRWRTGNQLKPKLRGCLFCREDNPALLEIAQRPEGAWP